MESQTGQIQLGLLLARRDQTGHAMLNDGFRPTGGGKESEFQLWISDAAERPLPPRIEYRPKSHLRLTFEMADARG